MKRLIIPILLVSIALGQSNQDSLLTVKLSQILIAEQVLDAITTTYGLTTGATESNLIIRPVGLTGFLAVKSVTIYLILKLIKQPWSEKDRKFINKVLVILDIYYLVLLTNNINQILVYHGIQTL